MIHLHLKNAGGAKLMVIKIIKGLTGLGLKECKALIDNLPVTLRLEAPEIPRKNITVKDIIKTVELLKENGADYTVTIE